MVLVSASAASTANPKAMTAALALALAYTAAPAHAQRCGAQAGGAICPNSLCCSKYGYCGRSCDHCGAGCQSQCAHGGARHGAAADATRRCGAQGGGAACPDGLCCSRYGYCGLGGEHCEAGSQGQCAGGVASVLTRELFDRMLPHRDDAACPARGFYTYDAFVAAARAFPAFAATGAAATRKREVAAFLAHTSHEISGGPYSWGYCYKEVKGARSEHCVPSALWPCASNKTYHARGPMQISYNYNYGPAGLAIGADLLSNPDMVTADADLLSNPDMVTADAVVAFKTALWLWMTPRAPTEPSCHAVATRQWAPMPADRAVGRRPGFGLTTSILTGGLQCAAGSGRVALYKRYCDVLGVGYGPDLDCAGQAPFDGVIRSSAQ